MIETKAQRLKRIWNQFKEEYSNKAMRSWNGCHLLYHANVLWLWPEYLRTHI